MNNIIPEWVRQCSAFAPVHKFIYIYYFFVCSYSNKLEH